MKINEIIENQIIENQIIENEIIENEIIEEAYNAHAMIKRCYEVLSWSGVPLSGGNCGMVAYAIADFLNSKYKIPAKLALLCEKMDNITDLCQLVNTEAKIYHVLVKFGSGLFDETGNNNNHKLLEFSIREYGDDNPDFWNNIDIYKDSCIIQIIREDTNWTTDWSQFKEFLKRKFK